MLWHTVTGIATSSSYFIYCSLLDGQCWVQVSDMRQIFRQRNVISQLAGGSLEDYRSSLEVVKCGEMWWNVVNVCSCHMLSLSSQDLLSLWNRVKWYAGLWQRYTKMTDEMVILFGFQKGMTVRGHGTSWGMDRPDKFGIFHHIL